jgi:hypothetical protein
LFGANKSEELAAAFREALAIEDELGSDQIAKAAATTSALKLAEHVRVIHKDSGDGDFYYYEFLRQAYYMKCLLRSDRKHNE